jgi:hypothetical protein
MERISALIEKLRGQFAEGADIDQLLLTAQLLEGELRYHKQKGTVPASPHVAVLMPNNHYRSQQHYNGNGVNGSGAKSVEFPEYPKPESTPEVSVVPAVVSAQPAAQHPEPTPPQRVEPQRAEPTPPQRVEPQRAEPQRAEAPAPDPEHLRYQPQSTAGSSTQPQPAPAASAQPQPAPASSAQPQATAQYQAAPVYPPASSNGFYPLQEVPTLTQQMAQEIRKDVNEALGKEASRSLNDTLKGQQKEVSMLLTETPIRDLKRAIGINDRYLFISELFRGDEIMYERSIKTINNFSIYQEAYYWMERELKLKLAWDMEKYSSQLFYQLVKRRFS